MKFLITSIILTWVWIWSFMKIVVEEDQPDRIAREYVTNSTDPIYLENPLMLQPSRPSYKINHNPLLMMWFGSFTYLMARIWFVWIHYLFGLDPEEEDEDEIEENDVRANDSEDD